MPVYEFVALNPSGKQIKGTVDADSITRRKLIDDLIDLAKKGDVRKRLLV